MDSGLFAGYSPSAVGTGDSRFHGWACLKDVIQSTHLAKLEIIDYDKEGTEPWLVEESQQVIVALSSC